MTEEELQQKIMEAIVAERVRIWNEIFKASSVRSYTEDTKTGYKTTQIITIGEPKLAFIITPELPSWYKVPENLPELAAPEHPSLAPPADLEEQRRINNENLKKIAQSKRKWLDSTPMQDQMIEEGKTHD